MQRRGANHQLAALADSFIPPSRWVPWDAEQDGPAMAGAHVLVSFSDSSTSALLALPGGSTHRGCGRVRGGDRDGRGVAWGGKSDRNPALDDLRRRCAHSRQVERGEQAIQFLWFGSFCSRIQEKIAVPMD